MSDKQQSAVQYLENIALKGYISPEDFERAKKLFKQQIIDASIDFMNTDEIPNEKELAEQYYNDKFKTESNGK
jgi:hypothetical protein